MTGHASHHGPKAVRQDHELDLSGLKPPSRTREWWEAVKREVAHIERREAESLHDLKMPKRDR